MKRNYIQGFFGAFIYSLSIAVIWVCIQYFMGFLSAALVAAVYFMSLRGYRKFKGKPGSGTKYVIGISNLLTVSIACILGTILELYIDKPNIDLVFVNLMYSEPTKIKLYTYFGMSFFSCLMIWLAAYFGNIINEEKKRK